MTQGIIALKEFTFCLLPGKAKLYDDSNAREYMAIYESEPNNTQSSANTLVLGEVIAGQAYGESDYYKHPQEF
ncbi:MAG: hypothetical protein EB072_19050 [Betaproteobacteria bacterium]|nr:hypothetical protein [Betaproteobacteria bacterium]